MINFNNPTENEIRRLVKEAADPDTQIAIIADLTGKSKIEIRKICGMKSPKTGESSNKGKYVKWTSNKVQYLIDHPNEPCQIIAEKMGLSYNSVRSKRSQLGIKRVSIWTDELTEELIKQYNNGRKAAQIAQNMHIDYNEVQKKIAYLKKTKEL